MHCFTRSGTTRWPIWAAARTLGAVVIQGAAAIHAAGAVIRVEALVRSLYEGQTRARVRSFSPVVFRAAMDGDEVARSIIDRQADELAAMAGAIARRLRLTRTDPDVVLAGAVFDTDDAAFFARLEAGVGRVVPQARLVRCARSPAHGAALLALDSVADPAV